MKDLKIDSENIYKQSYKHIIFPYSYRHAENLISYWRKMHICVEYLNSVFKINKW